MKDWSLDTWTRADRKINELGMSFGAKRSKSVRRHATAERPAGPLRLKFASSVNSLLAHHDRTVDSRH